MPVPAAEHSSRRPRDAYNGTFTLLALNFALFAVDHVFRVNLSSLYLHTVNGSLHQLVTSAFCHGSWEHLSGNMFLLLIFGKAVEQEEGPLGVWLAYLFCAIGANVATLIVSPASQSLFRQQAVTSLGASGAVFGLFAVSVLLKLSFDWRKMLEAGILGTFVVKQFLSEAATVSAGGVPGVNHAAHIGGAMCGVLLIALLHRLGAVGGDDVKTA